MAMSQLSVIFVLAVGLLASVGLFAPLRSPELSIVLGYLAAVLWGIGGIAAFSVHAQAWTGTKSMTPLAVISIGIALVIAALTTMKLRVVIQRSSGTTSKTAPRR
jgi:hypothetical protein